MAQIEDLDHFATLKFAYGVVLLNISIFGNIACLIDRHDHLATKNAKTGLKSVAEK